MTKEQVLLKLTSLCARSEHCSFEMLEKMRKWEVSDVIQAEVMQHLVSEHYVDDARYARFFINDKIKYNKWGRRKVEQALWLKHIDPKISGPILDEVEGDTYMDILIPLLRSKLRSVKGRNDYEIRGKLIRFGMSRGFDMDQVIEAVDSLDCHNG